MNAKRKTAAEPEQRQQMPEPRQRMPEERRYAKRQLIESSRWNAREKNQLAALLSDGKKYSVAEANEAVQTFANRRVD